MSRCTEEPASGRGSNALCSELINSDPSPTKSAQATPSAHVNPDVIHRASQANRASSARPRSCLSCRHRKVRADKELPCSTCWRAQVPCIYPVGRAPRRARPSKHGTQSRTMRQSENRLMERVKALEGMVEKLGDLMDMAPESKSQPTSGSNHAAFETQHHSQVNSPGSALGQDVSEIGLVGGSPCNDQRGPAKAPELHHKFGRLVLHQQSGGKRYVNGIWAKLDEQLSSNRQESEQSTDDPIDDSDLDSLDDDTTVHTPSADHHSYMFGYRSAELDLSMCLPEPLHVPYLWSIYQENVEPLLKSVHVPTMEKVFRDARKRFDQLSSGYQALVLAIYYAAVVSLEPEDVLANLGETKEEALARYRFATQQALSRADFLGTSDITVLQALSIFLAVVRHEDASRTCWSLTGLAIHLARGMGLHRDGSHLSLSPFEREMRRRLWWGLLFLDVRSAEELGTDLIVAESTFDTHMPSNINDMDMSSDMSETPQTREACTDTTLFLVRCEICNLSRRVIEAASTSSTVEEQKTMLVEVYQHMDHRFFKWIDASHPLYDVAGMLSRSLRAKMCFIIYQPVLFPQSGTKSDLTDEARECVYSAAINILEYNHLLNLDLQFQQYMWLLHTYTNWHATAYFLIESCRRPWTPLVERGWQALHGYEECKTDGTKPPVYESVVLPMKKLWLRVSKHRACEIARLSHDLEEANRLDQTERTTPVTFPFGDQLGGDDRMVDLFRARWHAMIRAGNGAIPTSHVQTPCPHQSVPSRPQTLAPTAAETDGSVHADLPSNTDCTSGRTLHQTSGTPGPLHHAQWLELAGGSSRQDVEGRDLGAGTLQTALSLDDSCPPSWLGPFPGTGFSFDELDGADVDMFGEDFDWRNWARNI
ncbi:hypothetical protein FDECE_2620 [Fusarium decemcellulare]|nr:hypothetical protein FDECE_2620 [Fusarium decemcellulare]